MQQAVGSRAAGQLGMADGRRLQLQCVTLTTGKEAARPARSPKVCASPVAARPEAVGYRCGRTPSISSLPSPCRESI